MFKKAERKQAKLKLAITGVSGSGKTMSALRLASGLASKIALIDTENGSASLYADKFNFDVVELTPPYTVEKYQHAIEAAEQAGYEVIVIDSISHSWAGEGGLLEQKEQLDARAKSNSFTNWSSITKKQEQFKNHILHSPCHIICTMRSKQEYTMQEQGGKQVPKKVGLAPIQRDGIEYEFTVVFDIALNHEAEATKDRTRLFDGRLFKITEETGKELQAWLNSGAEFVPAARPKADKTVDNIKKQAANDSFPEDKIPTEFEKLTDPEHFIIDLGNSKMTGSKLADHTDDWLKKTMESTLKWHKDNNRDMSLKTLEFVAQVKRRLAKNQEPKIDAVDLLV